MKKIKHSKGPWEAVLCVDHCGSSFIINNERDLDDPIAIVPNDFYHKELDYDTVLIANSVEMAGILFEIVKYEYNTEKCTI